jgi:hypothetical protein
MNPHSGLCLLSHNPERSEATEHGSTEATKHGSSEATFPAISSRDAGADVCAQRGWPGNRPGASIPNTQ